MDFAEERQMLALEARMGLTEMRDCIQVLEDSLERRYGEFESWLERETSGMTATAKANFVMWHGEPFEQLSETFPDIIRRFFFVACYSWYENWRAGLSRGLRRAELRPEVQGEDKDEVIETCRKIRNAIVHAGGSIRGCRDEKEIREFAAGHSDLIGFDELERIRLTRGFCRYFIETLESFCERLLSRRLLTGLE
jgi:hypothetical protein